MLPKLTTQGYRVCLTGCHGPHLEIKVAEDFYKVLIMYTEIILNEDFNRGVLLVVDMDQFTLSQMMMTTLPMFKKFMLYIQKSFPCRIKGIIVVNAPTYFDYLANLLKSTLSQKLQDRVSCCSSCVMSLHVWQVLLIVLSFLPVVTVSYFL
jgi:hypothetical protein